MTRDGRSRGGVRACSEMKSAGTLNVSKKISETLQGTSRVPEQMWAGRAQSRSRCGRGEPSPGADVGGASPRRMQLVARMPRGVYRVLSRLLHYRMLRAALRIVNVVRYTMHAVRYNMLWSATTLQWSATTCGSPLQHAPRSEPLPVLARVQRRLREQHRVVLHVTATGPYRQYSRVLEGPA